MTTVIPFSIRDLLTHWQSVAHYSRPHVSPGDHRHLVEYGVPGRRRLLELALHDRTELAARTLFLASFFPVAWLSGMSFGEVALRCAAFGAMFLAVLLLFALSVMEGGAGKLLAVTALWLPLPMVPWLVIVCVILAGALYLAMRYSSGRWLEVIGEKFASIIGVIGIAVLAIAA
jgi:hypothetical protein